MKRCTKCGFEKLEEAFEMQPSRGRLRTECRECRKIAAKEWYAKRKLNPPQQKPATKICNTCHEVKPISEFSPGAPGYFHGRCKVCEVLKHQEKRREQYRNDPTGRFYWPFVNEAGVRVKRCTHCFAEKPTSEFYTNRPGRLHGKCKDCDKTLKKVAYDANPEKYRASVRRSTRKYPDRRRARWQRWRSTNQVHVIQYQLEYNETHRDEKRLGYRLYRLNMPLELRKMYYAQHNFTRRARKANVPRPERIDRQLLIERDKWTCYLCKCICTPKNVTLDHVIPLARGGSHTADNLRVACLPCNLRKGTKMLGEFFA